MHSTDEIRRVADLLGQGESLAAVARLTGIPRSTIRNWRDGRCRGLEMIGAACPRCRQSCLPIADAAAEAYVYLLGQYLGDGGIYEHRRRVFRLVICSDVKYVEIIAEIDEAIRAVAPQVNVGRRVRNGCVNIDAYSRSWPCLFPQHGPGHKHDREIALSDWQRDLTGAHPQALVRGLLQSDGCRAINTVRSGGRHYSYPRYQFSNRSDDIRSIFCEHLDLLDIPWRRMNRWNISVARREGVARLDEFVGPKR